MSKIISIECDAQELRLAVGSAGITGIAVEKVLSAPVMREEEGQAWGTPESIEALKELLKQAGIKSGAAIACVSRNDIELRAITLPLVDQNELPDMVRFAAPRYFASVNDNWPLDFITMPSHIDGSIDCIVGAISPGLIHKIDTTVTGAGLTLSHMVLRPMVAAAGALTKHPEWNQSTVLFIDLLNDEADVVISEKGNAVFMRTFYSPTDTEDAQSVKMLASEVKRTIFSAVAQRPGLNVDQIVVWTKNSLAPFANALSQAVSMPVLMLDPFTMAEKAEIQIAATTQTVGRFAPVIGALHFQNESSRLIDFANPRKKVEAKRPVGRYIAASVAALTALGAGWWWYSSNHSALDSEIALLKQAVESDAPILKSSAKNLADWKNVESFMQGDVLWIDELERLSTQAKDSDTTFFGPTSFSIEPRSKTATVKAKFFTTVQDLVPEIQGAYRDEKHMVQGTGLAASQDKKYPVASDMSITVALNEVKDPRKVERKPIPVTTEEPATTGSEEAVQSSDVPAQENADVGSAPNPAPSSEPAPSTEPVPSSEPVLSTEPAPSTEPVPSTEPQAPTEEPQVPTTPIVGGQS
jgi:Tfp pilus assembly PilM family ATPase